MAEVAIVASVISGVASVVSLAMTLNMKPETAQDTGSSIDRKGQDNPKVVPFGRCLVPSVRVYNNVHNRETERLTQAHSFGVGKIKSYEQIYIDGISVFHEGHPISVGEWYSGNFNGSSHEFPNLSFGLRLGEETESPAFSYLVDYSDGQWTSDCRGDRTATMSVGVYRRINKEGDNDVRLISDSFKIEALIHGNAVIDPRFDTSLQGASDWKLRTWENGDVQSYRNPACVVLTYLLDSYYGLGLPADAVDIKSFIDLANHCDSVGLTFDGYVDQGSDYGQILVDMCSSFDGVLYVEDGIVKAKADKLSPTTVSIGMDDLLGTFKLSNASDSSYYNVVSLEYVNEDAHFSTDKYVLPSDVTSDATIIADGFEKTKDLKFLYTADSDTFEKVKRLANKHLKKAKNQRTIDFQLDNTLKSVGIFDVIEVTQPDFGLDKVKFRVTKVETTLDDNTMTSKVTAEEYNDSVYDESSYDSGITSPPIKPPTTTILAPVDVEFTQTGTAKGVCTWVNRHFRERKYHVAKKLSSESSWGGFVTVSDEDYLFEDLNEGIYDFRVRVADVLGGTSDWSTLLNVSIQGSERLPVVTGLSGTFLTKDLVLSWNDMKSHSVGFDKIQDIFSHYEVVVIKPSGATDTYFVSDNAFTYTFANNTLKGASRSLEVEVYVVDKDGGRSYQPAKLSISNPQCPQPSGVAVDAILGTVTITWDDPYLDDYEGTEVHISNNADFTPSVSTLVATSTSNSYHLTKLYSGINYVRVGHYDVFDALGVAYSPAESFTQTTIDDHLDESANWRDLSSELQELGKDIVDNATSIDSLTTTVGNQQSQITQNKTAITSTQGNLSSLETTVSANYGDLNGKITSTNQVLAGVDGKVEAITQIKHDVNGKVSGLIMGNDGETSTFDVVADKFRVSSSAGDRAVFQVNASTGATVIQDALIGSLSASKITSGVMDATRINASSTLTVGSGTQCAKLSGTDGTWRIAAGHSTMGSAPFRVDKTGKLFATNADIQGVIRANQLIFVDNNIPAEIKNSNVTTASIGAATTAQVTTAQNTANTANSNAGKAQTAANNAQSTANTANTNAGKAQTTANSAQTAANNAQASANTANSGVSTINGKMYPNQSKIQIKSSSYVAGSKGWAIDADGGAEFNQVTVRGTVYATDGEFFGTVKADKIVGDLVSAKAYSANQTQFTNTGTWNTVATITVTNNMGSRATFLLPPIGVASSCSKGAATPNHSVTASTTCSIRILRGSTQLFSQSFSASKTSVGGNAYAYAHGVMNPFTESIEAGVTNTYVVQINHTNADLNNPLVYVEQSHITAQLFRDGSSFRSLSLSEVEALEAEILAADELRAQIPEILL